MTDPPITYLSNTLFLYAPTLKIFNDNSYKSKDLYPVIKLNHIKIHLKHINNLNIDKSLPDNRILFLDDTIENTREINNNLPKIITELKVIPSNFTHNLNLVDLFIQIEN